HVAGAVASATVAVWFAGRRERFFPAGNAIVAALLLTALWSLSVATFGDYSVASGLAETARNFAWLFAIYRLFATDGRHASLAPIRPVVAVLAAVELLHFNIAILIDRVALGAHTTEIAFDFTVLFRLLVTVGVLVLVHNLYAGASPQ